MEKLAKERRRSFKGARSYFACTKVRKCSNLGMTKYYRFRSLRLGCVGVLVDTIRINVACDYLNDDLVDLLL